MKCPFCDAIVPAGSGVCNFCGEPIPGAVPTAKDSGLIEVKVEDKAIQEDQALEVSAISEESNALPNADNEKTNPSSEPDAWELPEDNMLADAPTKEEVAPAIDSSEAGNPEPVEPKHISAVTDPEKDAQPIAVGEEVVLPARKKVVERPKLLVIMAVLLFLCGVIIGGIFLGGRLPQEASLPTSSQESFDSDNVTNHENQTIINPEPSEVADKPLNETDPSEQDELGISPNENKPDEKIDEPTDSKAAEEFQEQIVAPDKATTVAIDPNFQGVWGVYLANDDGSIAYDTNGEMLFSGNFIVVDLEHQFIFNISEDGNLSNKWAIQKTEESNMITFWAENGCFSLAHLVTDSAVREICGTSGTDTFSMVWFKVDTAIPSYEVLLEEQTPSEAPTTAPAPSAPAVESQPVIGDYKDFPGVPDFGILNKVNPCAVLDLEGGSKVYIYLHSDLENAGTYMMSYNLYDQELLKKGFIQSGYSDNGSGSSTAANYGKYENGIATAVIINPLDNYGGEGCMSVVVGRASN